jgi:hypothetical protein
MELNPILIDGFVIAVQMENMKPDQVPIPYQHEVEKRIRGDNLEQE